MDHHSDSSSILEAAPNNFEFNELLLETVINGQCQIADQNLYPWILPEEAVLYEPKFSAIKDDISRYIFYNTPISVFEQNSINEFRKLMLNQLSPEEAAHREHYFLRFLYSADFNLEKALELLNGNWMYRTSPSLPVSEAEVLPYLQEGCMYWHGRDYACRPLLIIKVQLIAQYDTKVISNLVTFCFEFFLRYMAVAGRVENWNILADCCGTGVTKFPMTILLNLVDMLQTRYRGYLHRFFVVNLPRLLNFVSRTLLAAIPSNTKKKVRFLGSDQAEQFQSFFAPHQLECKYGGAIPNITQDYYPWRFYPGPFHPSTAPQEIRWNSIPDLHNRLCTSVYTGCSLHLHCNNSKQSKPILNEMIPWFHSLPNLNLSKLTAQWLCKRLVTLDLVCTVVPTISLEMALIRFEKKPVPSTKNRAVSDLQSDSMHQLSEFTKAGSLGSLDRHAVLHRIHTWRRHSYRLDCQESIHSRSHSLNSFSSIHMDTSATTSNMDKAHSLHKISTEDAISFLNISEPHTSSEVDSSRQSQPTDLPINKTEGDAEEERHERHI